MLITREDLKMTRSRRSSLFAKVERSALINEKRLMNGKMNERNGELFPINLSQRLLNTSADSGGKDVDILKNTK